MAPSQRARLELEDPLREPALWEARLFALFRALKELERALPKERDPLRRPGLRGYHLGLWDGEESSLLLELDTPLVPFFLHLLDRFLAEGKRPPARRGEQALFLSERGYGVGRVRRVEGGEAHLLVEGPATLVLPREEVVVLPRGFPVLHKWSGTEKLGKLLRRRYDHLVERLEGAGFRRVEILTLAAPFQVEADDPEGRRVYFRERGGNASLALVALPGLSSLQAFQRGFYAEAFWPEPLDSADPEETAAAFLALYAEAKRELRLGLAKRFFPSTAFRREGEGLLVALAPLEGAEAEAFPWGEVLRLEGKVVGFRVRREGLLDPTPLETAALAPLPLAVRGREGVGLLLSLLGPPPEGLAYEVRHEGEGVYRVRLGREGLGRKEPWKEAVEAFVGGLEAGC